MNKLIGCFQGMNEEDMIPYSLGSIYDVLDEVIFVEGAVKGWHDTPHSTDDTLDVIRDMDRDDKVTIVQQDDYWDSLEEMKEQFTMRIPVGDILVINDCDEIYRPEDLELLRKIIDARPQYWEWIPVFREFYGDFHHILRPAPGVCNLTNQRIIRMQSGMHYRCHHPTACIDGHRDSSIDGAYEDRRVVIPDFPIWHLSWTRSTERMVAKHQKYYETFDSMPPPAAKVRAEEHVRNTGSDLLYYDGPLPQVLTSHPLYDKDIVGGDWPNWQSTLEYRKPELIESPYNIKWSTPKASVVITCYDNLDTLHTTLPAWGHQTYSNYEVVVVEDGRPSDVVTGIQDYVESLGYTYGYNDSGTTYSISSARNIGIWAATGTRILFTDSDMIPDTNFILEHMAEATPDNITVGVRSRIDSDGIRAVSMANMGYYSTLTTGNMIPELVDGTPTDVYLVIPATGCTEYARITTDPRTEKAFPAIVAGKCLDPWEHCHGCNMSMHRVALLAINGFDEASYDGQWGAEDIDLAYRLIRKGLTIVPVPKSIGYHIDHPTRNDGGQRDTLNRLMGADIVRARPKSWGE